MSYTRAIYKADYEYRNEKDVSKELKVYVTYRLTMKNKSDTLITQINSIVDYYDANYELIGVGTQLDEKAKLITNGMAHQEENYNEKYKRYRI